MKKNSLQNSKLYVILAPGDAERIGLSVEEAARQAVLGGADIVQLRDKSTDDGAALERALRTADAVHALGGIFIVNDRPDIAKRAGADGVHLGQSDLPHLEARGMLGPDFMIGRSTHSLDQAVRAEEEGADYIGYGPIFATPTKPDYPAVGLDGIRAVTDRVQIPLFAIGGIDFLRLSEAVSRGARRGAVVRAAFESRSVFESVRRLKKEIVKLDAVHAP